MSQTTPGRARHARLDESDETQVDDAPTTALPSGAALFEEAAEFTDDETQAIPVIPAQRTGSYADAPAPAAPAASPVAVLTADPRPVPDAPAGMPDAGQVRPAPRRRVLPAVLAAVTAALLVAGVAVGIGGGAAGTDLSEPPSSSTTP